MNRIFRYSGYIICSLIVISAAFAVCGMAGIATHYTFNLSLLALLFSLSIFIFVYSGVYMSLFWILISISSFGVSLIMMIDFLRGGGHWLPVFNGRMWCIESIFFMTTGAVVFYFSAWRKSGLTRMRKITLATFGLSILAVSALYLCGAPLWLPYLVLYAGFGILLYGFRVPLFWSHYKKMGMNNFIEDAVH